MIELVVWPYAAELVDDRLKVLDVAHVGGHDVAVLAGHPVTLDGLGRVAGELCDAGELARAGADADDHAQGEAERARDDLGAVGGDDPLALQRLESQARSMMTIGDLTTAVAA